MKKANIVVAEDNTLLREGLCLMINSEDDLEVAAEAKDGLAAIRYAVRYQPDLILLDLSMPRMDGLSAISEIRKQCPDTRIMMLTIYDSDEYILECFQSGVSGYCLKDATRKELLKAIRIVLSGKKYISPEIADKVLEGYLEGKKQIRQETSWDTLTQREREVLKMVGEGYSSREIGEYLCISPKTVERHRSNIMNKLDLRNVSELTAFAIEKGLVAKYRK